MISLPVNHVLVKSLKRWWDCEATGHRMYFLSEFLNHPDLRFVHFSGCMNKQLPEILWRHETLLRVTGKWWTICCFCLRSDFWLVMHFWVVPTLVSHSAWAPKPSSWDCLYMVRKGCTFWLEGRLTEALLRERESEALWGVETVSLLVNTLRFSVGVVCGCGYVIG